MAKLPSFLVTNVRQISAKPIAFAVKFSQKTPMKLAVFYRSFFSEICPENSCEFPAKSAVFSANLSLEIPQNLTFFPRPIRSPV